MHYFLWFSEFFTQRYFMGRREIVHIYKIDDTEYKCTHVSYNENGKPLFRDTVLVAEGEAVYVRSLKTPARYRESNLIFAAANKIDICALCLDDTVIDASSCQLPCKHHFHLRCIYSWIIHKGTCPCCRATINQFT